MLPGAILAPGFDTCPACLPSDERGWKGLCGVAWCDWAARLPGRTSPRPGGARGTRSKTLLPQVLTGTWAGTRFPERTLGEWAAASAAPALPDAPPTSAIPNGQCETCVLQTHHNSSPRAVCGPDGCSKNARSVSEVTAARERCLMRLLPRTLRPSRNDGRGEPSSWPLKPSHRPRPRRRCFGRTIWAAPHSPSRARDPGQWCASPR